MSGIDLKRFLNSFGKNYPQQMQSQENRDATDQKRKKMLRELERQELLKTLEGGN